MPTIVENFTVLGLLAVSFRFRGEYRLNRILLALTTKTRVFLPSRDAPTRRFFPLPRDNTDLPRPHTSGASCGSYAPYSFAPQRYVSHTPGGTSPRSRAGCRHGSI